MDDLAVARGNARADALSRFQHKHVIAAAREVAGSRSDPLDPEVVFLDEPTAGLDPIGASAFDDLIKNLQATLGLTVFMVTHDLDSLYAICDRIAVLAEKRVLVSGTIEELMQQEHPWIKEYFHGPRGRAAVAAKERVAQAQDLKERR
jgi:phospholipid/cholesterol/gamma-HCH transport system ATP-binding protein